jgi:1,4-alpha-glucan branching enzyme
MTKHIPRLIKDDEWLKPYTEAILNRINAAVKKEKELTEGGSLHEFATGYLYFGLHKTPEGWVMREWAPNATHIYLTGTFNDWQEEGRFAFSPVGNGVWSLELKEEMLHHDDLYALSMHWPVDYGKRIPAWARYVTQDNDTKIFNARVWHPEKPYQWRYGYGLKKGEPPLIYEAHTGMAGEEERIHTYDEFRKYMLPRILNAGYNTVQLMAIPEHPYYGSFGYHVSSFFAPSSRFGTPDDLKKLIDEAHGMGLNVIMDIVHSHAVKNEIEGIGRYDGTHYQFFHDGTKGVHPAWDSYCFNYGKNEVLHFLLSNIKYWLEEFRFDGFRFDGVTSMLYFDHGLGKAFTRYDDYFGENTDTEATTYFSLANKLIKQVNPRAISIAEDMSGMPGLAVPAEHGGMGFDFRMAMGVPDYWIKLIKEKKDEEWDVGDIFYTLTSKRQDEKVVSYAESHDQALVGDKTIMFRLIDKEMYFSMRKDQPNLIVDRGIALHKMIRLITSTTAGGAYLNFMGNEFGHPEWIDFPREGNGWSYRHCRRIWSIDEDHELKFHWLSDFDREMIDFIRKNSLLDVPGVNFIFENKADQILAYQRGEFLFVFNFNPVQSFTNYGIPLDPGKYKIVLNTDSGWFGGQDRVDDDFHYYTLPSENNMVKHQLKLYLPARTAVVLKKVNFQKVV